MPNSDDDPWDQFVFDEDFVKGGVHEPPARTRAAISRFGDDKTSWRQGGPSQPAGRGKRRRTGRGRTLLTVGVIGAVVAAGLFLYTQFGRNGSNGLVADDVSGTIANTVGGSTGDPDLDQEEWQGLGPTDEVGSCYLTEDLTGETSQNMDLVDCSEPHDLELVSYQLAQGDNDVLPAEDYWSGSVAPICYQDMISFSGKDRDVWPRTWSSTFFAPTQAGWSTGDRTIYCMAATTPPTTGSVRDPLPEATGSEQEPIDESRAVLTA